MNHLSPTIGGTVENYKGIVLPTGIVREAAKPKEKIRSKPAAYLRLSRDDGKYKIVSASIKTQRDIVQNYADNAGLHINDFYIDDGWSGTNFDRPDWKRMMDDIASGKINMIISKDMSRIGGDAIAVGLFRWEYCLKNGIRLIAVSDGIDTSIIGSEESVQILNMYNDMYAKDISKKVRSVRKTSAKQGKFMGSKPPFGYVKSPEDKHLLVIDPPAAEIVKRLFREFAGGDSGRNIATKLNAEGADTPAEYYFKQTRKRATRGDNGQQWGSTTIMQLLKNQVYIGNMVQCKRKVSSFKTKKRMV